MEERPKRQAKKKIIGSDSDENPEEPELFQEDKQNPTLYDLLQVSKDAETSEIVKLQYLSVVLIFRRKNHIERSH